MSRGICRSALLLTALFIAAIVGACGESARDFRGGKPAANGANDGGPSSEFGNPDEVLSGTLSLEPADAQLDVSNGPASLKYKVVLTSKSGATTDVTDRAEMREEGADFGGALGTFNGASFTAAGDKVGRTHVIARLDKLEAKTSLTLRAQRVMVAAGADATSGSKFVGPDSAQDAPAIVYPASGVIVPPNMNEIEFHFVPGPGQDLFELSTVSPALDLKVYFGCQPLSGGCVYAPDKIVWNLLSSAGRDVDPLSYRIRATAKAGGPIAKSADRQIGFGRENITGGVYYWNAGGGQTKRYEFGVSGQQAETFLSPAIAGSLICVGCHAISRDGRFIAVGLDMPGSSYKALTVGTRQQLFAQAGASFFAFSPDGTQIMTSNGVSIVWRNTANGTPIKDPLVAQGTMPDWSADGASLVYARSKDPMIVGAPAVSKGELELIKWDGANWSPPSVLVARAGSENNYYPAFSPDSQWVVFNRSPSGKNSMGDSDSSGQTPSGVPDGQLWAVPAAGGSARRLDATGTGKDSFDSWPKWAPITQTYRGKKLMWFTFSSKRAYGLRVGEGERTQLWMAAFDPEKGAAGGDPSVPPFWLPFQELGSGNHIAQWVTRVERQPCGSPGTCAAGEQCIEGRCVPQVK